MIDVRTIDDSVHVIHQVLNKSNAFQTHGPSAPSTSDFRYISEHYSIIPYEFTGFGHARTKSLEYAWALYNHASHVWISDPDWIPDLNTIDIMQLDRQYDVFGFISYDRTNITTR